MNERSGRLPEWPPYLDLACATLVGAMWYALPGETSAALRGAAALGAAPGVARMLGAEDSPSSGVAAICTHRWPGGMEGIRHVGRLLHERTQVKG